MSDEVNVEADDYMEWVNDLLPHEHELVLLRSLNILKWEYTVTSDGIEFDEEDDNPDLQAALHGQYVRLFMKHIVEYLVQEGEVEPVCVLDNGEIGFARVEA